MNGFSFKKKVQSSYFIPHISPFLSSFLFLLQILKNQIQLCASIRRFPLIWKENNHSKLN